MVERFFRALRLDAGLYREVASDPALDFESRTLVVMVALLSSLGVLFGQTGSWLAYLASVVSSILLGWLLWAAIAWFVGTHVMGCEGSLGGLLRGLGYASLPRLLGLLGILPVFGWLFNLAAAILSLIAGIIAIREGLSTDTGKALIIALLGVVVYAAISVLIVMLTLPFKLMI